MGVLIKNTGLDGVKLRETNFAGATVNSTEFEIELRVAVIMLVPGERDFNLPDFDMLITVVSEENHFTLFVEFCVLPLL